MSYMSYRQLTHIKTDFSRRGLLNSKTLPNRDIVSKKDAVKNLQKEETDTILVKISLTLQNSKPRKDNLSEDERKALKEF